MSNEAEAADRVNMNRLAALLMAQHLGPTRGDARQARDFLSDLIEGPLYEAEALASSSSARSSS
jgi:hypothetical protein